MLAVGLVVFGVLWPARVHAATSLSFTTSDPDPEDTVSYQIQITNFGDNNFSYALIDFTSNLQATGNKTFTVGQPKDKVDGNYTRGASIVGLDDGVYLWHVRAIDLHGAVSDFTDPRKFVVTGGVTIFSITLSVIYTDTEATLTWNNPAKTAQINVYRSTSPNFTSSSSNLIKLFISNPPTTYRDTGLSPNSTYYYKVSAYNNAAVFIISSNEVTVVTGETAPLDPTNVKAVYDEQDKVVISWLDPTDPDVASITVYRSNTQTKGNQIATVPLGQSFHRDINVLPDKTYYYVLVSVKKTGRASPGTLPVTPLKNGGGAGGGGGGGIGGIIDDIGDLIGIIFGGGKITVGPVVIDLTQLSQRISIWGLILSLLVLAGASLLQKTALILDAIAAQSSLISPGLSSTDALVEYFISQPIHQFLAWLPGRKRRAWITVRCAETDRIIPRALIQFISTTTTRVVSQILTDIRGAFIVPQLKTGKYVLVASAAGFLTYRSTEIVLTGRSDLVNFPPTIRLHQYDVAPDRVRDHARRVWHILAGVVEGTRLPILIIGSIVAISNCLVLNNLTSWIMINLYLMVWILEVWVANQKPFYGRIVDSVTREPVGQAIIRIFRVKDGQKRLIQTAVTSDNGHFQALLQSGQYLFSVNRYGYISYRSFTRTYRQLTPLNYNFKLRPFQLKSTA